MLTTQDTLYFSLKVLHNCLKIRGKSHVSGEHVLKKLQIQ